MNQEPAAAPDEYVRKNRDELVQVLKHGNDLFVRSLVLAALVEFGDEPDIAQVKQELEKAAELEAAQ
jgi:hypothetical protein